MYIIGILSFLTTLTVVIFLLDSLGLSPFLDSLVSYFTFSEDSLDLTINGYLLLILIIFPLSYYCCALVIKTLKNRENFKWNYYNNLKTLVAYYTVFLVLFGFLPLFITMLNAVPEVVERFNSLFFAYSLGSLFPYFYIMFDEASNNETEVVKVKKAESKEKKQVGVSLVKEENKGIEKLKLHFKYVIVIFILIICTFGGLALYSQDIAIKGLSNAGLLLSIVLAVIAILITLWDVSGQKSNILDVKNSVQELKTVSAEITDMMMDYDVRNIESAALITSTLKEFEDSIKIKIESAINAFEKVEKIANDEKVVSAASIAKEELSESLKSLTTTIQNIPQANRAELFKRAQDSMKNYDINFQPKKK